MNKSEWGKNSRNKKEERQETKRQERKMEQTTGRAGVRDRQTDWLRLRGHRKDKALCPLEVLAYLPLLNIGLSPLSPLLCCPLENWLAKADMTQGGNNLADTDLLERITYF